MIQWIIENKRYDARYLANANKAAAAADKEPTWTQAAWLVKISPEGKPTTFLRGSAIGLPTEKRPKKDGTEWEFDPLVVQKGGEFVPFDPNDEKNPVEGDLLVDTQANGIWVKSVLQISGGVTRTTCRVGQIVGPRVLVELAQVASHGKRAVADIHRGVSQHTSGFYNVLAWMFVNVLIGNHDWMGGLSKATGYDISGDKEGKPFELSKHDGKLQGWGISIIRHETVYDKTTIFNGYPAKRVWYPFSSDIYQEVIPSIGDAYPYPIKALFLYMGSPVYALPAGHKLVEILSDPKKIPLFITSDIVIGETSMFADYIFPDLTYLERWEFAGSHPSVTPKVTPIRQPAAAPLTETVSVYGEKMPLPSALLLEWRRS
jgi:anaerobic selenocysteine-containing dehydrogenase